jgi:glucose-6-phosphate-specific signal transduction histidine kinase
VTESDLGLLCSLVNLVLLGIAGVTLARLCTQARQLARNTERLKDIADRLSSSDRQAARQVVRIAREISSDIGKLRRLEPVPHDRRRGGAVG